MYFTEEALEQLSKSYSEIEMMYNDLIINFTYLDLKNLRAREFAHHGFPRRVKIMHRCITNVFDQIPPERTEIPSRDELSDATINIQSFIFNTFGAMDNLAWIWIAENGQKRADGTPIPKEHIGLGPKNTSVRATLSHDFKGYLNRLDPWFEHLTTLRHALAHRIPLYIPPYVIQKGDESAYRDLETRMSEAIKRRNFNEYDKLSVAQLSLGNFRPWIQHSFGEGAIPVVFHAQMLADFKTVDEVAKKMLKEIKERS